MGLLTKSYTFTNGVGNNVDATQVNKDFDDLYTLVNGNIEAVNMKDGIITLAKLAAEVKVIESVTHTILTANYQIPTAETAFITQSITLSAQRYCLFLFNAQVAGYLKNNYLTMYDGATKIAQIWFNSMAATEGQSLIMKTYKQLTSGAHTIYVKCYNGATDANNLIYGDADGTYTSLTTIVFGF
jgi:hypothetical protein